MRCTKLTWIGGLGIPGVVTRESSWSVEGDNENPGMQIDLITDIFYANFIQWVHEGGNCYSTIKLYCNQLKAALVWASRHGCLLSQTYNDFEVPRYFKNRVALTSDEICHIAHFDISKVERRPQYRKTLEKVRDKFVLRY